jgi:ankyrin repeat protein
MQSRDQSTRVRLFFIFSSFLAFAAALSREVFSKTQRHTPSIGFDLAKNKSLFSSLDKGIDSVVDYRAIYQKLMNETVVSIENSRTEEQIEDDTLIAIEEAFTIKNRIYALSSIKNSAYASLFAEESRSVLNFNSDKKPTLLSLIKKRNSHLVKAYCAEPEKDFDFFARDNQGNTPLHLCVLLNCPEIFDVLRERYKTLLMSKNNHGDTVLHLAIQQQNMNLFYKILESSAATNHQNQLFLSTNALGLVPLSLSAAMGYSEMVRLLLNQYKACNIELKPYIAEALALAKIGRSIKSDPSEASNSVPKRIDNATRISSVCLHQELPIAQDFFKKSSDEDKPLEVLLRQARNNRTSPGQYDAPSRLFVIKQQYKPIIRLLERALNPQEPSLDDELSKRPPLRKLF